MSDRARLAGVIAGAVLIGVAATGVAKPDRSAPVTHTIVIDQMAFGKAPTDVRKGDVIVWVNRDMFRHTATARDKSFDVDLPPGKSAKSTVTRAGTLTYFCRYHPGMTGSLTVAEAKR